MAAIAAAAEMEVVAGAEMEVVAGGSAGLGRVSGKENYKNDVLDTTINY